MLDASRLAAGRLELELEAFDCGVLAREVVAQAQDEAARAGSALTLEVTGPTTQGVWDRHRIGQALSNIVANALKYGAGKPVKVTLLGERDRVELSCSDRGVGIDPSMLDSIFERFERPAAVRSHGGLGLGLYVAREIVRAHGGDITVESTLGVGSTFKLSLPRALPAH